MSERGGAAEQGDELEEVVDVDDDEEAFDVTQRAFSDQNFLNNIILCILLGSFVIV